MHESQTAQALRTDTTAGEGRAPAIRAAVLLNHPAQHFSPGFRLLQGRPELRTRVYYWNAATQGVYDPGFARHITWDGDLHSGYDWWAPPAAEPSWRRAAAVWRQLRSDRPDVLLNFGWSSPVARLGIAYANLSGTPLLYYGDTNWRSPLSDRHTRLRRLILRRLFRVAAGALATGTFNREFYISLGLDPALIHPGVYPMDTELFSTAAEARATAAEDRARRAGTDETSQPLVIGFAGKLLHIKGVDELIEAVSRLALDRPWELWLIGDGPLRPELETLVSERGLNDRVRFLGFKNTHEIPPLMACIDIMVMPSRVEPRGLVAIEAMVSGAATIVSSATGLWGSGDVVQHGETGLVYATGDIDGLTACLQRLADDPELRSRLAACGRVRGMSHGAGDFAAGAAAALAATARRHGRRSARIRSTAHATGAGSARP